MSRVFIILLILSNVALGQSKVDTVYYKDKYITTKKAKKAKYILVTEKIDDSLTRKIFTKKASNRKLWTEVYSNGKPSGFWEEFDEQGNLIRKLDYNFKVEYGLYQNKDKKFTKDNLFAIDPSAENEEIIHKHIIKTFRYPTSAALQMIRGTVVLMIIINPEGVVGHVRILKSVDPILDAEAYRITKSIPNLIPETKEGNAINVLYEIPITFHIQ